MSTKEFIPFVIGALRSRYARELNSQEQDGNNLYAIIPTPVTRLATEYPIAFITVSGFVEYYTVEPETEVTVLRPRFGKMELYLINDDLFSKPN